jgi:hypothetical protein
MRIAFIVDSFPAVSETFILAQIVGLFQRGHEVDIVADRLLAPCPRFMLMSIDFGCSITLNIAPQRRLRGELACGVRPHAFGYGDCVIPDLCLTA